VLKKALGAIALAVIPAFGVYLLTVHNDQVSKFQDAKSKCEHALAETADALTQALTTAQEKHFQKPPDGIGLMISDANKGVDNVEIDCLGAPLNWGTAADQENFRIQRENIWAAVC
jgi:hypothetical protein